MIFSFKLICLVDKGTIGVLKWDTKFSRDPYKQRSCYNWRKSLRSSPIVYKYIIIILNTGFS